MKKFYPTHLYVKTHVITGLKYFGKTTKADPHSYLGSGTYWLNHLKVHGKNITTEIIGYFENKDECVAAVTKFSSENNIVGSLNENGKKLWANQVVENGLDGGATKFGPLGADTKRKISEASLGRVLTEETKQKIRKARVNQQNVRKAGEWKQTDSAKRKIKEKRAIQVISKESREKAAKKLRGRKRPDVSERFTGIKKSQETKDKMKLAQQDKGPLSEDTKQKIREARKLQLFTLETKEKLKGKVVCINMSGELSKIDKEVFYSQTGSTEQKVWVFHNSTEGKKRKLRRG